MEGDAGGEFLTLPAGISIHALRVEGDATVCATFRRGLIFLSTPSGWRATGGDHAEMEGIIFLSTPSGWRATGERERPNLFHAISIHALRVEGDRGILISRKRYDDFYPRPPGGGRLEKAVKLFF